MTESDFRTPADIWPGVKDYYNALWPVCDLAERGKKAGPKQRKALAATAPTTLEQYQAAERFARETLDARIGDGPDLPDFDEQEGAVGVEEIKQWADDVHLDAAVWDWTAQDLLAAQAAAAGPPPSWSSRRPRAPRGKGGKIIRLVA